MKFDNIKKMKVPWIVEFIVSLVILAVGATLFTFVCIGFFLVVLSFAEEHEPMKSIDVQHKVQECNLQHGKVTIVYQGTDKKNVTHVQCELPEKPDKDSSVFDDDDTTITAGGMPSMSGLPGGPF